MPELRPDRFSCRCCVPSTNAGEKDLSNWSLKGSSTGSQTILPLTLHRSFSLHNICKDRFEGNWGITFSLPNQLDAQLKIWLFLMIQKTAGMVLGQPRIAHYTVRWHEQEAEFPPSVAQLPSCEGHERLHQSLYYMTPAEVYFGTKR